MSTLKVLGNNVDPSATPQSVKDLATKTGNVYRSLAVMTARANQISSQLKQELHGKLEEFATSNDNLEEVHENREQIEISKYYEKLPNPSLLSLEEFKTDQIYFRERDEEA